MSPKIKYMGFFFSVLSIIVLGVVFLGNDEKDTRKEGTAQQQIQPGTTHDQYRMAFGFIGDKSQIIDLIKGKAKLNTVYSGNSKFTSRILFPDGATLITLADVNGFFTQKQVIDVPETGEYLLDVRTTGEWSFSRE